MPELIPVEVPRETANDDSVYLMQWLVKDGEKVVEGQPLCVLESSKANFEVTSPGTGYLFSEKEARQEIPVGDVIGVISPEPMKPSRSIAIQRSQATADTLNIGERKISGKALKLIEQHSIDPSV